MVEEMISTSDFMLSSLRHPTPSDSTHRERELRCSASRLFSGSDHVCSLTQFHGILSSIYNHKRLKSGKGNCWGFNASIILLAAIIAATTGLTNAVTIADDASTASVAIDSAEVNFAETDVFAPPKKAPGKAQ